jgi:hypothetical protein
MGVARFYERPARSRRSNRDGNGSPLRTKHADLLFEGGDDPRRRRLRKAHLAPGDGKTPTPRDSGNELQRKEPVIHSGFAFIKVIFSDYCKLPNNPMLIPATSERPRTNERYENKPCPNLTCRRRRRRQDPINQASQTRLYGSPNGKGPPHSDSIVG